MIIESAELDMMRLLFAALWMTIIFATSSTVVFRPTFMNAVGRALPGQVVPGLWGQFWHSCGLFVVKGYHVAEFVLLYLLVERATARLDRRRATIIAVASCLCFAISDEWHQTFIPGRGGTWTDVAIDMSGVILVAWVRRGRRDTLGTAPSDTIENEGRCEAEVGRGSKEAAQCPQSMNPPSRDLGGD